MTDKNRFIDLKFSEVPDGISSDNKTRVMYLSAISRTEFLSQEDIENLINKLHSTKNETEKTNIKNRILISYQPLIFSLATKYATNGNQMDYVSEASIKFLEAIDSYDTSKGSLSTYMINCIVNHYANIYQDNNGSISVPMHSWEIKKLRRLVSKFVNENEREPEPEELEEMCRENEIDIHDIRSKMHIDPKTFVSLDWVSECSETCMKLEPVWLYSSESLFTDDNTSYLDKERIIPIIKEYTEWYTGTLKFDSAKEKFKRNVEMLMDYYGITDGFPKTFRSLADKYCIDEEMVRVAIKNTKQILSEILPREQLCA